MVDFRDRPLPDRCLPLHVYYSDHRAADAMEELVGGERFEMSKLPDSMIDTTLFVGNLCEFVNDNDLSNLFGTVSILKSVPACVVRKPDMTSLKYGFVSFPSVKEKEAALLRFHNYEFKGRSLKVEPIRDHPSAGRVRLPERMISYVSGSVKTVSRKSRHGEETFNTMRRISCDDVERLSRGQPAKTKGYGSRSVPHRLNDYERAEFERAQRKGFVSLLGGGNRRSRKGSPLANIFRQWCDARAKPQIILYKTVGSESKQPQDRVVVDLSPLRLYGTSEPSEYALNQYMSDIEKAAATAGMKHCPETGDDDDDGEGDDAYKSIDSEYTDESNYEPNNDRACDDSNLVGDVERQLFFSIDATAQEAWANRPIWQLPVLTSGGTYLGERSQAKNMAKALAILWKIPEEPKEHASSSGEVARHSSAGTKKGGKTKMKGLSHHRTRGGGHRQSWY